MDPKLLTESGLKAVLSKNKIKDNGLQKALAAYEKLEADAHDDRLQKIAQVSKLATALKKDKEVTANKEVVRYLEDLLDAADQEEKKLEKDKAAAKKTEAAHQKAQKEKEDKEEEDNDEDGKEEQEGEYGDQLLNALRKVKGMNGSPMSFIYCEARPLPAIMVARRISSHHRKQLTEITGGSKKFLHLGTCHYEDGQYVITTDKKMPGLARRLQLSVKNYTGKKFKFLHGDEAAGDDDSEGEGVA